MSRRLLLLVVLLLSVAVPAWRVSACEGSEIVFEDKFHDDAGGWSIKDTVEVKDGAFTFKLPPDDMQSNLNVTFTVKDADICLETVWPEGEQPVLGAGVLFWGEDNRTYFQFGILNNGKFWIARKQDGRWLGTIAANVDFDRDQDTARRHQYAARQDRRQYRDLLHQRHQGPRGAWASAQDRLALRHVRRQFRQAERGKGGLQEREGHQLSAGRRGTPTSPGHSQKIARPRAVRRAGIGAQMRLQRTFRSRPPTAPALPPAAPALRPRMPRATCLRACRSSSVA